MSEAWVIVLWSVIPAVVLLPMFTVGAYWLFRHFNQRGRPPELPVERAYRQATAREMTVPGAGRDDPASRHAGVRHHEKGEATRDNRAGSAGRA